VEQEELRLDTVLKVKGLTKTFRRRGRCVSAVRDMSFSAWSGEVLGLLGPNGAGKSTTIKCILGLVQPDSGEVEVFGRDAMQHRRECLRMMSAVLEGSRNVYWRLTPRENVRFFASIQGRDVRRETERLDGLLHLLGLGDWVDVPAMELSQGMKQKTAVACALARDTPLIFLDEPTLGLDVETSIEMRGMIRHLAEVEQRTVVLSSHDMKVVQQVCDRVVIIEDGAVVVDDTTDNLISLFQRRLYRVRGSGRIDGETERQLREIFRNIGLPDVDDDSFLLEVEVARPEALYDLMDILRANGILVEGISQDEPDLERAFLQIIGREEGVRA